MDTVPISDSAAASDSGVAAMAAQPKSAEPPQVPQLDEDRLAWLALALAPGLGPKRILDAVAAA